MSRFLPHRGDDQLWDTQVQVHTSDTSLPNVLNGKEIRLSRTNETLDHQYGVAEPEELDAIEEEALGSKDANRGLQCLYGPAD